MAIRNTVRLCPSIYSALMDGRSTLDQCRDCLEREMLSGLFFLVHKAKQKNQTNPPHKLHDGMSLQHQHRPQKQYAMDTNDDEMGDFQGNRHQLPPQPPVLVRYEVANNVFEVPERYKLKYAIGQGAYGVVWCVY